MSVCLDMYTYAHTYLNVYVYMYQHINICMKNQKASVFKVH